MPIISTSSSGSGGIPNPVTTPVNIAQSPNPSDPSLTVVTASGQSSDLMEIHGTQAELISAANGGLTLSQITDTGTFSPLFDVAFRSDMQSDLLAFDQGFSPFTTVLRVSKKGYLVIGLTAAPADAELSANQAALWFDSTNGAAKLMVKAKSANGTVVTGSVALA